MNTLTPGQVDPSDTSGDSVDYPYGTADVLQWLLDRHEANLPGERVFVEASLEVMRQVVKDNLPQWGPRPGSKAEGEYEKAFAIFYSLEAKVRPLMVADGVER